MSAHIPNVMNGIMVCKAVIEPVQGQFGDQLMARQPHGQPNQPRTAESPLISQYNQSIALRLTPAIELPNDVPC